MSKVLVNDTTLSALGDIVRENTLRQVVIFEKDIEADGKQEIIIDWEYLEPIMSSLSNPTGHYTFHVETDNPELSSALGGLTVRYIDKNQNYRSVYFDNTIIQTPTLNIYKPLPSADWVPDIDRYDDITIKYVFDHPSGHIKLYVYDKLNNNEYTLQNMLSILEANENTYKNIIEYNNTVLDVFDYNNLSLGLKDIKPYHLCYCNNIKKIIVSSKINSIGSSAFASMIDLEEVICEEGVKTLYSDIFSGDYSLKKLDLPETITKVDRLSSSNIYNLTLTMRGPVPNFGSLAFIKNNSDTNKLYVQSKYINDYLTNTKITQSFDINNILPYDLEDLKELNISGSTDNNIYKGINSSQYSFTYNTYNNVPDEQKGVIWSCSDNATITQDGEMTPLDSVSEGDVITITITSTYNPEISKSFEVNVVSIPPIITVNINSQWKVADEQSPTGETLFSSDKSYHKSYGIDRARLTFTGISNATLKVRSNGENNYDYLWITKNADIKTSSPGSSVPSNAIFNTKGKASATVYTDLILNDLSDNDYIDIYYSKDSSGDNGEDRGYFYIPADLNECQVIIEGDEA